METGRRTTSNTLKKVLLAAILAGAAGALAAKFYKHRTQVDWPFVACCLLWTLFTVYWSWAETQAPAKTAESRRSRKIHEILMNVGYLLILLPPILPPSVSLAQYRFLPPSPLWIAAGLSLQVSCFALAVWARRNLGSNWSGRVEIKVDHLLVRSGPYRLLRHPIYTAVVGMAAGSALTLGKMHALLAVAFILIAYIRKIRLEESTLYQAFGPAYDDYRRATWGLVPGLF